MSSRPIRRYLPVSLHGSTYVVTDHSLGADDGMSEEEFGAYIRRRFNTTIAVVEILGKRFQTRVFEALERNDCSYIAVDENLTPVDSDEEVDIPPLDSMHQVAAIAIHAESIVPDQRINLRSFFVRPRFQHPDGDESAERSEISWEECLNYSRAVISGAPGSGKTSCLRRITLELSDRDGFSFRPRVVPIYVMLRHLEVDHIDLYALASAAEMFSGVELSQALPSLAMSGNLVLLLDGLDEVPDNRRARVEESIRQLGESFARLRIIVTTRDSSFRKPLEGYSHLRIKPFNDAQIREWSWNWLGSEEHSTRLYRHICESPRVHSLARNPLLLCLTASVYQSFAIPPHDAGSLLSQYVNALVETWDRMRGVHRRSEPWASPEAKLSALCAIAFNASNEGLNDFSTLEAQGWLASSAGRASSEEVLGSLASHTGLLNEHSPGRWAFTHKVFQEWLTAQYIVRSPLDAGQFLRGRMASQSWRDIWTNACALTTDPSYMFDLAEKDQSLALGERAGMFADALCQQLRLPKTVLSKSCSMIVGALEHDLAALRVCRVERENPSTARHWRLVQDASGNPNRIDAIDRVILLLRAVYRMRTSVVAETLRELLRESHSGSTRTIAELLESDGPAEVRESLVTREPGLEITVESVASPG